MIAIYAQDLESAQRLALKRGIPCGMWEFVCSEGKFKRHEFKGVVLNELQSDKTIEFLMTQSMKTEW